MYVHGRRGHALVRIEGPKPSQQRWHRHTLRV
jgi:hypothetical protein